MSPTNRADQFATAIFSASAALGPRLDTLCATLARRVARVTGEPLSVSVAGGLVRLTASTRDQLETALDVVGLSGAEIAFSVRGPSVLVSAACLPALCAAAA